MVLIDGKEVEINGTRFIIHKAPATVAYNAALEYGMGQDNKDADAIMRAVYKLMAYVEIVLSDEYKEKYPKLAEYFDSYNDNISYEIPERIAEYASWVLEDTFYEDAVYRDLYRRGL